MSAFDETNKLSTQSLPRYGCALVEEAEYQSDPKAISRLENGRKNKNIELTLNHLRAQQIHVRR
jgi:hypothetical protein